MSTIAMMATLWVFIFTAPNEAVGRQVGPMTKETCEWFSKKVYAAHAGFTMIPVGYCVPVEVRT